MADFVVHGWAFSPYVRAVRFALGEKEVAHDLREMTPGEVGPGPFRRLSPFGKVPALEHAGRRLHETLAILTYLDAVAAGRRLQPDDPFAAANGLALALAASHSFYPTGVMGVFFGEAYVAANGGRPDDAAVQEAAAAVAPVLDTFEDEAQGPWLAGAFGFADIVLAPMIDNLRLAPTGAALLATRPKLTEWFRHIEARPAFTVTRAPIPLFGLPG